MLDMNTPVVVYYICPHCDFTYRAEKKPPVPAAVICPECGQKLKGGRRVSKEGGVHLVWFQYS
jgi:ssDNA-binding Zn-finger/Zn-ribbon topoisomerase 1